MFVQGRLPVDSILPFEMLLQLPEQKLHGHLVMASQLYPLHSHWHVSQLEHTDSGITRRRVNDLLCLGFSNSSCSVLHSEIRPTETDALKSEAACWALQWSCMCTLHHSSVNHLCLHVRLVSTSLNTDSCCAGGDVWSCGTRSYINHQLRLACGSVISLLNAARPLLSVNWYDL